MADEPSLYDVLGVPPDADFETLRTAWRKLATVLHPDRNPDPEAEALFRRVSQAYGVLSCPDRRLLYDRMGLHTVSEELAREMAQAVRECEARAAARRAPPPTVAPGASGVRPAPPRGRSRSGFLLTHRPHRSRSDDTGRTWWGGSSMDGLFGRKR